jgi:DNA-binding transcriptional LysR family regulator
MFLALVWTRMHAPNTPEVEFRVSNVIALFGPNIGAAMRAETWGFSIDGSPTLVPVHSRLQIDAAESVIEAALAGAGIIRLFSYHVATAVKDGRLSVLQEFETLLLPVNPVSRRRPVAPESPRLPRLRSTKAEGTAGAGFGLTHGRPPTATMAAFRFRLFERQKSEA